MKNFFILFLSFIYFENSFSQDLISSIKEYNPSIINTNKYKILIISDSGCGYCKITYKKMESLIDSLQVIVIDYSNNKEIREKYKNFTFISSSELNNFDKEQDFFPVLFLFDKKNKLIWKKKGWFKENLKKIKKKINYY